MMCEVYSVPFFSMLMLERFGASRGLTARGLGRWFRMLSNQSFPNKPKMVGLSAYVRT